MSGMNDEHPKELVIADDAPEEQVGGGVAVEELKVLGKSDDSPVPASDKSDENSTPSPQQQV